MSNAVLVEDLVKSGAVRSVPVPSEVRDEVDAFVRYASARLGKSRSSRREFAWNVTPATWQARLLAAANEGDLDAMRKAARASGLFRVNVTKLDEVLAERDRRHSEAKKAARRVKDRRRQQVRKATKEAARADRAAMVKAVNGAAAFALEWAKPDLDEIDARIAVVTANLERAQAMEAAREARKSGRTIPASSRDIEQAAGPLADLLAFQRAQKTGWVS